MTKAVWLGMTAAAALLAAPVHADVKTGVDAWARGDYPTAIAQWRGPAEAGDADAQFNLGQAYRLGRGVPRDLAQAEKWFRGAALKGHPQAEDNYGLALYENGKRDEALPWLQKSATRGEPRAQYLLATMYFNGETVKKDWVQAYALVSLATAQGLPQAQAAKEQMERYLSLADRQAGSARADAMAQLAAAPAPASDRAEVRAPAPPAQVAATTPPPARADGPAPGQVRTTELPPSSAYRTDDMPAYIGSLPPGAAPAPEAAARRAPAAPVTSPSSPAPPPHAAPVATATGWRVQLGAFGNAGNARALWSSLSSLPALGGTNPHYERAGALTKLQAGPFASAAEAGRACAALKAGGRACLVVKP